MTPTVGSHDWGRVQMEPFLCENKSKFKEAIVWYGKITWPSTYSCQACLGLPKCSEESCSRRLTVSTGVRVTLLHTLPSTHSRLHTGTRKAACGKCCHPHALGAPVVPLTWDASATLPGQSVRSVHTEPQLFQENFHFPCKQHSTKIRQSPVTRRLLTQAGSGTQPSSLQPLCIANC